MSRIPKPVKIKIKKGKLSETPGVYFMLGHTPSGARRGEILYIGKAANLRRRVENYFSRPRDRLIERMIHEVRRIDYEETANALEALVLESLLIKKHKPPYNVLLKDDKSFLHVEITRDPYPVVHLVRGKSTPRGTRYGPFTSTSQVREALKILRRIFPFNTHAQEKIGTFARPCFDAQVGLCPRTCVGEVSKADYKKTIRNLKYFFEGKRTRLMKTLEREMKEASKREEYEKAEKIKRQLFGLRHVNDIALIEDTKIKNLELKITKFRIEGYDISNLSGESSVGSMVVFIDGKPDKNEYRKFKIKTVKGSNDTAMLREVLERRLQHNEWQMPDTILIDGGKGQVNVARSVLNAFGLKIHVIGIAKGPERRKNEFVGIIPKGMNPDIFIAVRDEAHRFAQSYHKKLRGGRMFM